MNRVIFSKGLCSVFFYHKFYGSGGDAPVDRAKEQGIEIVFVGADIVSGIIEIVLQNVQNFLGELDSGDGLSVPFTHSYNVQSSCIKGNISAVDGTNLRDPKAAAQDKENNGLIPDDQVRAHFILGILLIFRRFSQFFLSPFVININDIQKALALSLGENLNLFRRLFCYRFTIFRIYSFPSVSLTRSRYTPVGTDSYDLRLSETIFHP